MTHYEIAKAHYEIAFKLRYNNKATAARFGRFLVLSDRWLKLAGFSTAKFWKAAGSEDSRITETVRP